MKDRAAAADLIFMPYNYLIDEKIRENFSVEWENSIVIFDEAHNCAPVSEEVSSFEIKSTYLHNCLIEVQGLREARSQNEDKQWQSEDSMLELIKLITERFQKFVTKYSLTPDDNPTCIQNISNNRYLPA